MYSYDRRVNRVHARVQAQIRPLKNALLSDVCISTSAAPTYLPAHFFQTKDDAGNTRDFNLIDGGVAANNPVSVTVTCAHHVLGFGGQKKR